jgi:hypothetical protein
MSGIETLDICVHTLDQLTTDSESVEDLPSLRIPSYLALQVSASY